MTKSRSRKRTNRFRSSHPTVIVPSAHSLEYSKLRDAIVEANQIIKDKETEIEKKKIENDYLTMPLILLLRAIFGTGIFILALFIIVGIVLSYTFFDFPKDVLQTSVTSVFWFAFISDIITFLVINRRHQKKQQLNSKVIKIFFGALLLLCAVPYVWALFLNQKLFSVISIVVMSLLLLVFCYLAIRTLNKETDRSFLVSYFSAIVSIAALAVSAVALFVSQQ